MNPNVRLFASLIAVAALGGCYVQAGGAGAVEPASYEGEYVETEEAPPEPPPPPVEVIPVAPSPAYVWIQGSYGWHAHVYTWHRGHYEQRPRERASWMPGHWEKRGHRHVWIHGHWM